MSSFKSQIVTYCNNIVFDIILSLFFSLPIGAIVLFFDLCLRGSFFSHFAKIGYSFASVFFAAGTKYDTNYLYCATFGFPYSIALIIIVRIARSRARRIIANPLCYCPMAGRCSVDCPCPTPDRRPENGASEAENGGKIGNEPDEQSTENGETEK